MWISGGKNLPGRGHGGHKGTGAAVSLASSSGVRLVYWKQREQGASGKAESMFLKMEPEPLTSRSSQEWGNSPGFTGL